MLISKNRFLGYQNSFYRKILSVPYKIKLEVITVQKRDSDGGFNLEEFLGESPRKSDFYEFQALYEKEISNRTREKFGLPKEVNGVIYLSPKQLIPKLGDYHLDWNKTKIHFEGHVQVIDRIIYLEEMYNSCVGIQIFIKDALKGG